MKDIKTVHTTVEKVLKTNENARKNDNKLIFGVLKEMGIDTSRPVSEVFVDPKMPNLESITRARRKIQHDCPDLKDDYTAQLRAEQEENYRNYAIGN